MATPYTMIRGNKGENLLKPAPGQRYRRIYISLWGEVQKLRNNRTTETQPKFVFVQN